MVEGLIWGVTPRMLELRDAPVSVTPVAASVFVGAYLLPGGNATHTKGAFAISTRVQASQHVASMYATADRLVARSPGLCARGARLVVMHNLCELPPHSSRLGVGYVRVAAAGFTQCPPMHCAAGPAANHRLHTRSCRGLGLACCPNPEEPSARAGA